LGKVIQAEQKGKTIRGLKCTEYLKTPRHPYLSVAWMPEPSGQTKLLKDGLVSFGFLISGSAKRNSINIKQLQMLLVLMPFS